MDNIKDIFNSISSKCQENLLYTDEGHQYKVEGNIYDSVTTILRKVEGEFNEEAFYQSMMNWTKRKNCTIDLLRAEGKYNKFSLLIGSEVHSYIEFYYRDGLIFELKSQKSKDFIESFKIFDENVIKNNFENVAVELKLYSKEYKVAGTLDSVFYHKETDKLYIIDWKTSKRSDCFRKAPNKATNDATLKSPFGDVVNTKYNKYCIQLLTYKKILREWLPDEYKDKIETLIVHLNHSECPMVYPVDDNFIQYADRLLVPYKK